jgi:CO/xanthine dehydrogenase Mo-binding subunit
MNEETLIGKSIPRIDAWQKVNGQARFVADVPVEDCKMGVVLRSPHHHARILKIDTSEAEKGSGLVTIITAKDIPGKLYYGALVQDRPALADQVVRFIGEPVALIIAETREIAEKARSLIHITYELLSDTHDPKIALEETAPKVHAGGNLLAHFEVGEGEPALGFAEADVILEETFNVPRIYPGYLEPETSLAVWNEDETLSVWVSSQKPFDDRHHISSVLGLPEEQVHVISGPIGGAFGGKEDSNLPVLTSLAAYKIKGSVRFINTREESILAHPKRHPCQLEYKVGAKKDGTITALTAKVYVDTGAYASYGPAVAQLLTETIPGPYRIPNTKADTYVVYTNNLIGGAMRGFGSPQTNFAYESLIDMLAEKLNMDAGDFRRKNIWQIGDANFTRAKVNQAQSVGKSLEIAIQERDRLKNIPAKNNKIAGVGFAMGLQTMGLGAGVPDDSSNRLEWLPDGKVRLSLGAPDLGQGLMTVAAQMTAESLGLSIDQVEVSYINTSSTPNGGVTCASRMTYMVGNSVAKASRSLISALLQETARLLHTDTANLKYQNGEVLQIGSTKPIPVCEITSRLAEEEINIENTATVSFPYGPETPNHLPIGMPHVIFCIGAQVARIEVDPQLGTVEVTDIVAIHDLGRVINRQSVEGQIEGGVAMGIGYALNEEVKLKENGQWVDNLTEYLMATSMDMPANIKCILLEEPEESSEFGIKGIGEITLVPTAAAITNAIYNAIGVRAKKIPVTPETLLKSA